MIQSDELAKAVHALATALPRHTYQEPLTDLPANGIYIFFERGEEVRSDDRTIERIIRIGTHRAHGRLPKRLRQHINGNRRASVFRRHLGGALLTRDDARDPRLPIWLKQKGVPIP